jgi:adenylyltransferase/sulfurtransferase
LKSTPEVSSVELVNRLAAQSAGTDNFLVVDVREPNEFAESSIPTARLLPIGELLTDGALSDSGRAALPQDTPLILHCHAGGRAARAANALREAGFTDVSVLTGGILAWDDLVTAGGASGIGSRWESPELVPTRQHASAGDDGTTDQSDSLV